MPQKRFFLKEILFFFIIILKTISHFPVVFFKENYFLTTYFAKLTLFSCRQVALFVDDGHTHRGDVLGAWVFAFLDGHVVHDFFPRVFLKICPSKKLKKS